MSEMIREVGDEHPPRADEIESVTFEFRRIQHNRPSIPKSEAVLELAAKFKMQIGMVQSIVDSILDERPIMRCTINGIDYTSEGLQIEFARDAIEIQDACNLGGVSNSFSKVVHELHNVKGYAGTDWIRSHPIVIMYVCKIVQLTVGEQDGIAFSKAYDFCKGMMA